MDIRDARDPWRRPVPAHRVMEQLLDVTRQYATANGELIHSTDGATYWLDGRTGRLYALGVPDVQTRALLRSWGLVTGDRYSNQVCTDLDLSARLLKRRVLPVGSTVKEDRLYAWQSETSMLRMPLGTVCQASVIDIVLHGTDGVILTPLLQGGEPQPAVTWLPLRDEKGGSETAKLEVDRYTKLGLVHLIEPNPLMRALRAWLGSNPNNVGRGVYAGQLLAEINAILVIVGGRLECDSPAKLANAMYRQLESLTALGYVRTFTRKGPTHTFSPVGEQLNRCKHLYTLACAAAQQSAPRG